ncbi:uncharacterized protein LOC141858428 [Brevipalpus obovatus]|uniref:uncharacterized protein LOC141858428 n=1 Tax=Brevipalpus obovatus TaxID=246614 RepID=UPI003D9EE885
MLLNLLVSLTLCQIKVSQTSANHYSKLVAKEVYLNDGPLAMVFHDFLKRNRRSGTEVKRDEPHGSSGSPPKKAHISGYGSRFPPAPPYPPAPPFPSNLPFPPNPHNPMPPPNLASPNNQHDVYNSQNPNNPNNQPFLNNRLNPNSQYNQQYQSNSLNPYYSPNSNNPYNPNNEYYSPNSHNPHDLHDPHDPHDPHNIPNPFKTHPPYSFSTYPPLPGDPMGPPCPWGNPSNPLYPCPSYPQPGMRGNQPSPPQPGMRSDQIDKGTHKDHRHKGPSTLAGPLSIVTSRSLTR